MTFQWTKLGQLYVPTPEGRHPKLMTHAANPLPIHIEGDIYRILYNGRDIQNRSSVGAVDIDILKRQIVNEYHEPFFEYGPVNSFYSHGVSIGSCYIVDDIQYLFFMGWQIPEQGHWRGDIGRLIVHPDLTLELDRNFLINSDSLDPLSLSYPCVLGSKEEGFHMWYGSTITWDAGNDEMIHVIKYAFSPDGHTWRREGVAVPYRIGYAQAFSRPSVYRNKDGRLDMWFSYRGSPGKTYRIGYATSSNGKDWELLLDMSGIDVSDQGWDSEMIEYPYVFEHKGEQYMLYNGNSYGKSGFGLAIKRDCLC